ncbi:MAG: tRNA (adenosine(37)-N6)-dimethylallyltransferase MiaA [Minisyncoccota bacterium]
MLTKNRKVLVIIGPTASGKSALALVIAQRYDGEIISADSRQIYRGMDIGTGKVTPEEQSIVPHHLLSIIEPYDSYNVTHFIQDAQRILQDIRSRDKVPILCGGTGFWIQALLEKHAFPSVPPNPKLRETLNQLSTSELFQRLSLLNAKRAQTIDAHNKVRLIRALEIQDALGHIPPPLAHNNTSNINQSVLILALNPPQPILADRIAKRLTKRLDDGMLAEVAQLQTIGVTWERLEELGLEYRFGAQYLQQKISRDTLETELLRAIKHYAKRQITWIKRWEKMGVNIHWITDTNQALEIVKQNF